MNIIKGDIIEKIKKQVNNRNFVIPNDIQKKSNEQGKSDSFDNLRNSDISEDIKKKSTKSFSTNNLHLQKKASLKLQQINLKSNFDLIHQKLDIIKK